MPHAQINHYFLPVLLFAGALGFAFFGSDHSLWLDEAGSVQVIRTPWERWVARIEMGNSPPLHFLLARFWAQLFGFTEPALRSLSGLFYLATLGVLIKTGREIDPGKPTGLFAAFFFMMSPLAVFHAQNIRPYALLGFLSALSVLFFIRIFLRGEGSKKAVVFYGLIHFLGLLTHYWYGFLLFAQGVVFLLAGARPQWKAFSLTGTVPVLLFASLWLRSFLVQLNHEGTSWMPAPDLPMLVNTFTHFIGGGGGRHLLSVIFLPMALLVFLERRGSRWMWRAREVGGTLLRDKYFLSFLGMVTLCVAVPFLLSFKMRVYLPGRYTIIAIPAFVLLCGYFLSRSAHPRLVAVFLVVLFLKAFIPFVQEHLTEPPYSDKKTARLLVEQAKPGDWLIFTSLSRATIDYYLGRYAPETDFNETSFPKEIAKHPIWRDFYKMEEEGYHNELRTEAKRLADDVLRSLRENPSGRVWLFYGRDLPVSRIIKEELDRRLRPLEKLDWRGTKRSRMFTEVWRYGLRA